MELSSQRTNGSDPFNLCQKHTDEEVPNARPLPWGRHTPPLAAPFLLLDSLTGAPHLSSFTVQSGETARLASPPPAPHATAARLPRTRTQTEQRTRLRKIRNGAEHGMERTYWNDGLFRPCRCRSPGIMMKLWPPHERQIVIKEPSSQLHVQLTHGTIVHSQQEIRPALSFRKDPQFSETPPPPRM